LFDFVVSDLRGELAKFARHCPNVVLFGSTHLGADYIPVWREFQTSKVSHLRIKVDIGPESLRNEDGEWTRDLFCPKDIISCFPNITTFVIWINGLDRLDSPVVQRKFLIHLIAELRTLPKLKQIVVEISPLERKTQDAVWPDLDVTERGIRYGRPVKLVMPPCATRNELQKRFPSDVSNILFVDAVDIDDAYSAELEKLLRGSLFEGIGKLYE